MFQTFSSDGLDIQMQVCVCCRCQVLEDILLFPGIEQNLMEQVIRLWGNYNHGGAECPLEFLSFDINSFGAFNQGKYSFVENWIGPMAITHYEFSVFRNLNWEDVKHKKTVAINQKDYI